MSANKGEQVRYTTKQAADAYGISVDVIRHAINSGALAARRIPASKPGAQPHRWSISRDDMDAWVENDWEAA